ncbi:MAG: hypothetical protein ACREQP_10165, partial [Candidatus Binatia bacterium]
KFSASAARRSRVKIRRAHVRDFTTIATTLHFRTPTHERHERMPLRLLRLTFDLLTGFSLLPIQMVGLAGILISFFVLALFLGARFLLVGSEGLGVLMLFAVLFFFVGLQILALGLVGEYVGRIYMEVRRRPKYVVKEILA